jgi:hypothetical protein
MDKKTIFSWILSLILIGVILSIIDLKEVFNGIKKIGLINFIFLSALYSVGFLFRALRWKLILHPITKTSLKDSFFITSVGFFVNVLLPARAGEITRAYLLAKKKNIGKIKSFSTVMLDRIIDGLTLFLFFVVAVLLIDIPMQFQTIILVPATLFGLAFLFFFKPDKFKLIGKALTKIFPSLQERIKYFFKEIKEAGNIFYSEKKQLLFIFLCSVYVWSIESLVFYFTAQIMGIQLSLLHVFLLIVVIGFASMIPSAPNYAGTFEAGFIVFFIAFGLSKNAAISMGIAIHLIQTAVIVLLGLISVKKLNLSLKNISKINFLEIKNKIKGKQK